MPILNSQSDSPAKQKRNDFVCGGLLDYTIFDWRIALCNSQPRLLLLIMGCMSDNSGRDRCCGAPSFPYVTVYLHIYLPASFHDFPSSDYHSDTHQQHSPTDSGSLTRHIHACTN